ncbi:ribonuclease H-like domain-containing protein [Tanacetum coccineum]
MKSLQKGQARKLQFDAKELIGFNKTKVECYSCHKTWHFARECRSKGNQDSRRRDTWNTGNKDKRKKLREKDLVKQGGSKAFSSGSDTEMCDKKNKVLFTNSECLVLSLEFKLPDENHVLLRIPRQNNMYSFNLKNIGPSGGLACLIAKAQFELLRNYTIMACFVLFYSLLEHKNRKEVGFFINLVEAANRAMKGQLDTSDTSFGFTICAGSSNGFYWLCYIPTGRLCWLKKVQISDSFATTQQQSVTALVTDLRQKYGH